MNIPFTTEAFFQVIENYNLVFFPVQIILLLLGVIAIFLLHSERPNKSRFIGGFLGILWLWTGIAYHLALFTTINKAAYGFGALYVLQGILFFVKTFGREKLVFVLNKRPWDFIGYFFIVFGLILYPILIYLSKESLLLTITLGLPCPSTIFTFGFLMLTTRAFSKYLLIIPTIWAIIGTFAAIHFEVYPDYMLLVTAVVANLYLLTGKKEKPDKTQQS